MLNQKYFLIVILFSFGACAGEDDEFAQQEPLNPASEMVNLIREIKDYVKSRNPNFIVIQQNAAQLIEDSPTIINYIDGISQEAIWYDGVGGFDEWESTYGYDARNDSELSGYYLNHLLEYQEKGIPVWCVEYAVDKATQAYNLASDNCFTPYCTRRSLGRLTITPPANY